MPVVNCKDLGKAPWGHLTTDQFNLSGGLHIWRLQISSLPTLTDFTPTLSKAELERAAAYRRGIDKNRFIVSHGFLRILMSKYLNLPPAEIIFSTGSNHKPFIQQDGKSILHYNLSHSEDQILIAVAESPLGIDVEHIIDDFIINDVLPDYFSKEEIHTIKNAADRSQCFFSLWARKEALIKATGTGMNIELQLVPCLDGGHTIDSAIIGSAEDWEVSSFDAGDQYLTAIAYSPFISNIQFFEAKDLFDQ